MIREGDGMMVYNSFMTHVEAASFAMVEEPRVLAENNSCSAIGSTLFKSKYMYWVNKCCQIQDFIFSIHAVKYIKNLQLFIFRVIVSNFAFFKNIYINLASFGKFEFW